MHDHITSNKQNPTQKCYKILKNFQKPQKFQENPKPRSKCVKCMKNEGLKKHTKEELLNLGRNPSGENERVEGKEFGVREGLFYRKKKREMKVDFALKLFKQIVARWIKDLSRSVEH